MASSYRKVSRKIDRNAIQQCHACGRTFVSATVRILTRESKARAQLCAGCWQLSGVELAQRFHERAGALRRQMFALVNLARRLEDGRMEQLAEA